jgi:uncharacterized protein YodC (DUF2158 family)
MEIGDLVILKSGGPVMTITGFNELNPRCSWFKEGECFESTFAEECLKLVEEEAFLKLPWVAQCVTEDIKQTKGRNESRRFLWKVF